MLTVNTLVQEELFRPSIVARGVFSRKLKLDSIEAKSTDELWKGIVEQDGFVSEGLSGVQMKTYDATELIDKSESVLMTRRACVSSVSKIPLDE